MILRPPKQPAPKDTGISPNVSMVDFVPAKRAPDRLKLPVVGGPHNDWAGCKENIFNLSFRNNWRSKHVKLILLMVGFFWISHSHAEVTASFPSDEAAIFIQGQDSDAISLFDQMRGFPREINGTLAKRVVEGHLFDLKCDKEVISGNVSCALKVFAKPGITVINPQKKFVSMEIYESYWAAGIAESFYTYGGEVFRSLDGRLRIWKTFKHNGEGGWTVATFTIQYQE